MSALGQQRQGQLARCGGLCPLYFQKRTWIGATGDVRLVPKAADMIGTVWRPMSALLPKADKQQRASACPLSAKSGHLQRNKLFDHLVGAGENRG
jgi:hypothetical protein